jgi:hypothetical protein
MKSLIFTRAPAMENGSHFGTAASAILAHASGD